MSIQMGAAKGGEDHSLKMGDCPLKPEVKLWSLFTLEHLNESSNKY